MGVWVAHAGMIMSVINVFYGSAIWSIIPALDDVALAILLLSSAAGWTSP
jgi:hypothetical protein